MYNIESSLLFRLHVGDSHELDFIANRYCTPALYRADGECDIVFRKKIIDSLMVKNESLHLSNV